MLIRDARGEDWPHIWPFWRQIVAAGETYAIDPETPEETARALWMGRGRRVFVAQRADETIVGSAYTVPNYGGAAAGIANAGFMVDPAHSGQGVGRRLAAHVLRQAKADGYHAMVFNAVVATNPAVRLWTDLGFTIVGTVPDAFDHPRLGRVGLHVMHREL